MTQKKSANLEVKENKSTLITNAFFIGFLVGIVIYSVAVNNFGFLTLIPLYLAYKLISNRNSTAISPKEHSTKANM